MENSFPLVIVIQNNYLAENKVIELSTILVHTNERGGQFRWCLLLSMMFHNEIGKIEHVSRHRIVPMSKISTHSLIMYAVSHEHPFSHYQL